METPASLTPWPPRGGPWLSIADVIAYLGPRRQDKPIHRKTVVKWMNAGLRGVRLRSVMRAGAKSFTTVEWLEQFFEDVTQAKERRRQQIRERTPPPDSKLKARYRKAKERLEAAGLL